MENITITPGPYGDGVSWSYNDGTLSVLLPPPKLADLLKDRFFLRHGEAPWNDFREQIHTVQISDGVTTIIRNEFYLCKNLINVYIPDSVTEIGSSAFSGCSSLASITIPASVTNIGSCAFLRCSSLTSVTIPHGVTSIEPDVFAECTSLASVTIPASIASIDRPFAQCKKLKDVYYNGSEDQWKQIAINGWSKSLPRINIHYNA